MSADVRAELEEVPTEELGGDPSEEPETPERDDPPEVTPQATVPVTEDMVIEKLREVHDPEIPINIIDLGLVYAIDILPARVDVQMTLTALGCPMAGEVMADVRDHLLQLPGVQDAGVELVYDPPWNPERMSEDARWELGLI